MLIELGFEGFVHKCLVVGLVVAHHEEHGGNEVVYNLGIRRTITYITERK
jgi:hypothetical protein